MSKYGRVCPSARGCPSVRGCAPVLEGVSQCEGGCLSVGGWAGCACVSLPYVLMGDVGEECVQVYMCMSVIVTCTYLCINMRQ